MFFKEGGGGSVTRDKLCANEFEIPARRALIANSKRSQRLLGMTKASRKRNRCSDQTRLVTTDLLTPMSDYRVKTTYSYFEILLSV